MSERKRKLLDEIRFYRDLIASRHATLDLVLSDTQRLELLFVKAKLAFEDEDETAVEQLSDEIVRIVINRIALLLTEAQKSFVRGRPDLRFKGVLETVKEIHTTVKDFDMSSETKEWFTKNDEALNELLKGAQSIGKQSPRPVIRKVSAS